MDLFILRHADAEFSASSDAARELTPKGREQALAVGTFCNAHRLRPQRILTSPYRRAVQTAEGVAQAFDHLEIQAESFLASGMTPEAAFEGLRTYPHVRSLMIVGHQPDLGLLVAALLGLASAENFPVEKASLTLIEAGRLGKGGGSLRFSLSPALMKG